MSLKNCLLLCLTLSFVVCDDILSSDKPIGDGFGVNIHFTHPLKGELQMIRDAGFKWVRMDFFWERTEQSKGVYNFSDYDYLLSELKAHNMSAYFILDYNNKIYENVVTESGRRAYTKWAVNAITHFKANGILWEIWNEPNGNGFWNGHANVTEYVAMALAAMKEIRGQIGSGEIVVGPATSGVDLSYLEECFRSGLLQYWDAVSVHPYRQNNPESVLDNYFELRQLIAKYGPKGKRIPIISGEWGYSAAWNHFDETIQGQYLQRELLANVMYDIPISIWYDWHNDGNSHTDPEHNFGIVNNAVKHDNSSLYEPKEAYITAKTMNSVLNGFKYVKRIATKDTNDYVILFTNEKNEKRLAVWTTIVGTNGHNISIASDECDFEVIDHKGSLAKKVSSSGQTVVIAITDFVQFLVAKCNNNTLLKKQPGTEIFDVQVMFNRAPTLPISVKHIFGRPVNETITLTHISGFEPMANQTIIQSNEQLETSVEVKLKSKPANNITVGMNVQFLANSLQFGPNTYVYSSDYLLNDCTVGADGDPKVKSEQSVSVESAPEKLFGEDVKTLKLDYHMYGKKFLNVNPKSKEYKTIPGVPKSIAFCVYAEEQGLTYKMRIIDKNGQVFQIRHMWSVINWKGWKYISVEMSDIETHWGGPNDGKIAYPVEFLSMFLLENVDQADKKGNIHISPPIIIY